MPEDERVRGIHTSSTAPALDVNPYFGVHHVFELSDERSDKSDSVVALYADRTSSSYGAANLDTRNSSVSHPLLSTDGTEHPTPIDETNPIVRHDISSRFTRVNFHSR